MQINPYVILIIIPSILEMSAGKMASSWPLLSPLARTGLLDWKVLGFLLLLLLLLLLPPFSLLLPSSEAVWGKSLPDP